MVRGRPFGKGDLLLAGEVSGWLWQRRPLVGAYRVQGIPYPNLGMGNSWGGSADCAYVCGLSGNEIQGDGIEGVGGYQTLCETKIMTNAKAQITIRAVVAASHLGFGFV